MAGATTRWASTPRLIGRALAGSLIAAALGFLVVRLPDVQRGNIGTSMPTALPARDDPVASAIAIVVTVPLLIAGIAAWAIVRLEKLPAATRRTRLLSPSLLLAALFVFAFVLTPYTIVPYESERLPYRDFAIAHVRSLASSVLSWDQDTLSWKLYFGVSGWHDVFYPDGFYALCKWALILLLICIPVSLARETDSSSKKSALLILIAGLAASLSVGSLTLRYFQSGNPWGCFMFPWLPLLLTPPLIPIAARRGSETIRLAIQAGVLVQLWTAVSLPGTRYLFGQG